MKKLTRKLTLSLVAVLFAMLALGTSTFAWFSMNTTVTASDISVTAVTPKNLLIHDEKATLADETTWKNKLSLEGQNISSAALYPASTNDGIVFNAITDGNYIGSNGEGGVAQADTIFMITDSCGQADDELNGYFVVYEMYLKLSEEVEEDEYVYVSKLSINDDLTLSDGTEHAYLKNAARVAVFYQDLGDEVTTVLSEGSYKASPAALLGIYALNDADESYKAITGNATEEGTIASAGLAETAIGNNYYQANSNGTYAKPEAAADNTFAIKNNIVKVTLVIWYEGQDSHCININAGATITAGIEFSLIVK